MSEQELYWSAYRKLGELGARRRFELGMTTAKLAEEVNVPIETIAEFEHGLGPAPTAEMRMIEWGLSWDLGSVDRLLSAVHAGRVHPDKIIMEMLDAEDAKV